MVHGGLWPSGYGLPLGRPSRIVTLTNFKLRHYHPIKRFVVSARVSGSIRRSPPMFDTEAFELILLVRNSGLHKKFLDQRLREKYPQLLTPRSLTMRNRASTPRA
jgi:hypothetical protein